jgi:hypothetical protein
MKNSFISDVDMTFPVIHEKYISEEYLEESTSVLPAINGKNTFRKLNNHHKMAKSFSKKKISKTHSRKDSNIVDNLILSHLSTKRKEYSIERFEKIFERFDDYLIELKKQL